MAGLLDFLGGIGNGQLLQGLLGQNRGVGGGLLASDPAAPRATPIRDWAGDRSNALLALGSGLLSQPTFASGLSAGFAAVPQARQMDRQRGQEKSISNFFADPANTKALTPQQVQMLAKNPKLAEAYLTKMLFPAAGGDPYTLNPGDVRFGADNKPIATNPKPPPDPTDVWRPATPEELKARNLPEDTPAQINTKTGQLSAISGVSTLAANNQKADDSKIIAGAIISGNQPPDLARLYGASVGVRAELEKQGYNLTTAQQDWQITQRQLQTMSNPQQTRIRQNISFANDSLDKIEELTKDWKAGQFPALNKVVLETAKQGGLGDKAASVATQLEAQISDLVADLAGIYMGGNSPTDHALELAQTQLKSSWSENVLLDMIKLARTNLGYRENSLKTATVGFPNSQYNPFTQPAGGVPPAAGGVVDYTDFFK